ncbi:hypothetical protein EDD86DRAFT_215821 [Gorgonomyces haynaldii]|nr:hypothetical protein EDD86DRAFT_215821 [Gorgonomyces haynaldii]
MERLLQVQVSEREQPLPPLEPLVQKMAKHIAMYGLAPAEDILLQQDMEHILDWLSKVHGRTRFHRFKSILVQVFQSIEQKQYKLAFGFLEQFSLLPLDNQQHVLNGIQTVQLQMEDGYQELVELEHSIAPLFRSLIVLLKRIHKHLSMEWRLDDLHDQCLLLIEHADELVCSIDDAELVETELRELLSIADCIFDIVGLDEWFSKMHKQIHQLTNSLSQDLASRLNELSL